MEFMGTKEASRLWGILQEALPRMCRQNKIPGAEQDSKGSPWRIPRDAERPEYRRRKKETK